MSNPPFLDPEPIASTPPVDEDDGPTFGPEAISTPSPVVSGPCADCARYARIGYVIGAVVGVAAGGVVAYVILKNRLAPLG